MTEVFVDYEQIHVLSDVSFSRKTSDLIGSCNFTASGNLIRQCRDHAPVQVYINSKIVFDGIIFNYKISNSGSTPTLTIDCSDRCYLLSHSDAYYRDINSAYYATGDPVGNIIEEMCDGMGIGTSGIKLRDILLLEDLTIVDGQTRYDIIKYLCGKYGAIFFLEYTDGGSNAICDIWENLLTKDPFSVITRVSDSSHLIQTCDIESVPEMNITRVIAYEDTT